MCYKKALHQNVDSYKMKKIFSFVTALIMAFAVSSCTPDNPLDDNGTGTEQGPAAPDGDQPEGDEGQQPGEGQEPGGDNGQPGVEPAPTESYYVKVAKSYDDWSGDYLITYTDGSEVIVLNGFGDTRGSGKDISSSLTAQGIHSSTGDLYKAVVAKDGNGYTINVTNVGYIGLESSSNSLSAKTASVSGNNKYQ